jgi:hypothetical protein
LDFTEFQGSLTSAFYQRRRRILDKFPLALEEIVHETQISKSKAGSAIYMPL